MTISLFLQVLGIALGIAGILVLIMSIVEWLLSRPQVARRFRCIEHWCFRLLTSEEVILYPRRMKQKRLPGKQEEGK